MEAVTDNTATLPSDTPPQAPSRRGRGRPRRKSTLVPVEVFSQVFQNSQRERQTAITPAERHFATDALEKVETDILTSEENAALLAASGDPTAIAQQEAIMRTREQRAAAREKTLREVRELEARRELEERNQKENIPSGNGEGGEATVVKHEVVDLTDAPPVSTQKAAPPAPIAPVLAFAAPIAPVMQSAGHNPSQEQLMREMAEMKAQQAAYEAQNAADFQKQQIDGRQEDARKKAEIEAMKQQLAVMRRVEEQKRAEQQRFLNHDPVRIEALRVQHENVSALNLNQLKDKASEVERLRSEQAARAEQAAQNARRVAEAQHAINRDEQARLNHESYVAALSRARTDDALLEEMKALEARHRLFADRNGHTGAWTVDLIKAYLFCESPLLSNTFSSDTARCEAMIETQVIKTSEPRRQETGVRLKMLWESVSTKFVDYLISPDKVEQFEEPVRQDLGGMYYVQDQTPSHLVAMQRTEPIMRALQTCTSEKAVIRFVGGFDKFYAEMNTSLHWGTVDPYGYLLKFFTTAVMEVVMKNAGELKFDLRINAGDLDMVLNNRTVTSNSMRLWINLHNVATGYSVTIPICSIEPEHHTYPIIVGELLTMSEFSPHGLHSMDRDTAVPIAQSFRAYIHPTSGNMEVMVYSAPIHHLKFMADHISGRLPGQAHSSHLSDERRAYYAGPRAPRIPGNPRGIPPRNATDFTLD
ncbi:hypothetical protein BJ508DRAFT_321321 [Ascobolus immersus RN42]|uniref:Uncharacterized protein n=1 Tax=Ascobolus immersus RN42 TaxID=1160509 RepID=A0A3N4IYJ6_ASCIM|nr:hypothetical protein BJ508DRAFT_321321 [Ascobolus immersus RN42]